jgi:CheY-like chemotaxis protein
MSAHIQADSALLDPQTIRTRGRQVARVLLADTGLASRLTLNTILTTAGYAVSSAATAAEAVGKLDESEYQLVLADLRQESEEAGSRLLAYARQKEYRPATALICSDMSEPQESSDDGSGEHVVRISNENVSYLLARVAELISLRADRRIRRAFRRAS